MSDLPNIFKGKVGENINNNKDMIYTSNNREEVKSKSIDAKINDIFSAKDFVYKKKVTIITKNGAITKEVVGINDKGLLTLDNEVINLKDILDIK